MTVTQVGSVSTGGGSRVRLPSHLPSQLLQPLLLVVSTEQEVSSRELLATHIADKANAGKRRLGDQGQKHVRPTFPYMCQRHP